LFLVSLLFCFSSLASLHPLRRCIACWYIRMTAILTSLRPPGTMIMQNINFLAFLIPKTSQKIFESSLSVCNPRLERYPNSTIRRLQLNDCCKLKTDRFDSSRLYRPRRRRGLSFGPLAQNVSAIKLNKFFKKKILFRFFSCKTASLKFY
jgi:hypothetical protein